MSLKQAVGTKISGNHIKA